MPVLHTLLFEQALVPGRGAVSLAERGIAVSDPERISMFGAAKICDV
jgi:hypothetical protein